MKLKAMMLSILTLLSGTVVLPSKGITEPKRPELVFSVLSDIHVQSWDRVSTRKLGRALEDLQSVAPSTEALIINGDAGNGFPEDYEALQRTLHSYPHPNRVWYTIGNHEFYKAWHGVNRQWSERSFPNGETEQASIERFLKLTGESKVYYDRWLGGYHFLFLGSERYRQSNPSYGEDAWLSAEQLDWLRRKLQEDAAAAGGKPIFVFLHQPLQGTVSGSEERGVVQLEEVRAILAESHPQVLLFSGHSHYELDQPGTVVRDGFTMINTSSVRQPYTASNEPAGAEKSEGLVVQVYEDAVRLRGRDFASHAWIRGAESTLPLQRDNGR